MQLTQLENGKEKFHTLNNFRQRIHKHGETTQIKTFFFP